LILTDLKFVQVEFGSLPYKNLISFRYSNLRAPLNLEWSKADLKDEDKQFHFAVYLDNEIIGCCALKKINDSRIRLRQMAVLEKYRGMKVGTYIIKKAEDFCQKLGIIEIDITARCYALQFYRKNGYSSYGDIFIDVTLESVKMKKVLNKNLKV